MKHFASLIIDLDQTNKTNGKIAALEKYFHAAPDEDKLWAIALLSGRRPRSTVNSSKVRGWANEEAGISEWLFSECYQVVGDMSETIALLLPDDPFEVEHSLRWWMLEIIAMGNKDDDEKRKFITSAWKQLGYFERFVFNKLIGGSWRIGVSQKLVVKALSNVLEMDANKVSHCLMGNWTPENTTFSELLHAEVSNDVSRPYPFYLAYALDLDSAELGEPADWQAEWKWDGIRGQIIKREGQLFVWSRGEDLVTDKFPEYHILKDILPDGTVLDGEIMPFRDEQPLPFNVLQTRIGRKNITPKILKDAPVAFISYDVLEWEGKDIRDWPMRERRELLSKIVEEVNKKNVLRLSPVVEFDNWNKLAEWRMQSRDFLSEGIMLKKYDSPYETGRKRGSWWKWKVDPLTIDAVLIYASRGSGRRANLYTDYTFAVWDDKGTLIPFTKAYSGLTDQEIREVDAFIKKNTLEKFGPVRSVTPELVFEIAFEGIAASPRHKSGIALRFPRIMRWRKDKPPKEADTLTTLRDILKQYGQG
jgi:DNA ligase-1